MTDPTFQSGEQVGALDENSMRCYVELGVIPLQVPSPFARVTVTEATIVISLFGIRNTFRRADGVLVDVVTVKGQPCIRVASINRFRLLKSNEAVKLQTLFRHYHWLD